MPVFGTFTDPQDGHVYRTVLMPDGNWWFAEDYKYDPENNAQTQWSVLYLVYNIPSAPPGCHTPSEAEWWVLQASLSPKNSAGILLRSATDWTTSAQSSDSYGFNAKPSGVCNNGVIVYSGIYAGWWLGGGDNQLVVTAREQAALFWYSSDALVNAHAIRFIVDSGNIPDPTECAPVTYSPPAGTYGTPQTVALSTETAGASIYYTVDGSEPTAASPIYTAPLTISESTTVKAIAVKAGLDDSAVTSALYTILPPVTYATGTYTDVRDNHVYKTIIMPDGNEWFAENLAYNTANSRSISAFGRVYPSTDFQTCIPTGCRLPTFVEWQAMLTSLTNQATTGYDLRSTTDWADPNGLDTYGFSVKPGGWLDGEQAQGLGSASVIWVDQMPEGSNAPLGAFLIFSEQPAAVIYPDGWNRLNAIRCIVNQVVVASPSAQPTPGSYTSQISVALLGNPDVATTGTFTDTRDQRVYKTVLMPDGKWWLAENLAFAGVGLDYDNNPANRTTYGRLYTYANASAATPPGAHVPTQAEWGSLILSLGGDTNGAAAKAVSGWGGGTVVNGKDTYGFTALPGGYYNSANSGVFDYLGSIAYWLTAGDSTNLCGRVGLINNFSSTLGTSVTDALSLRVIIDSGNVPDYTIYYTTDGSTPSKLTSPVYSAPIQISTTCTVKAVAVSKSTTSDVASFAYTFDIAPQPAPVASPQPAPVASPDPGLYSADQTVTLTRRRIGTFTDPRDGHLYKTVMMPDGKWWVADNISFAGAGVDYNNDQTYRAKFGRLYNWKEAAIATPVGMHIPSSAEFDALILACGGTDLAGVKLKARDVSWLINTSYDDYGFHALPSGFGPASGSLFEAMGEDAYFTTSTTNNLHGLWVYNINGAGAEMHQIDTYKELRYALRCIIDSGNIEIPTAIYYTVDASSPVVGQQGTLLYTNALLLTSTTLVRAIVISQNTVSQEFVGTYTIHKSNHNFGTFIDTRDNHVYKTIIMPDGREWLAENLAYNSPNSMMISSFGRVYPPTDFMECIPPGCIFPSFSDWQAMLALLPNQSTTGFDLRSTDGWLDSDGLDTYGFGVKPSGCFAEGQIQGANAVSAIWVDQMPDGSGSPRGVFLIFSGQPAAMIYPYNSTEILYSIRCIVLRTPPPTSPVVTLALENKIPSVGELVIVRGTATAPEKVVAMNLQYRRLGSSEWTTTPMLLT